MKQTYDKGMAKAIKPKITTLEQENLGIFHGDKPVSCQNYS
jgi:hypothetical protein